MYRARDTELGRDIAVKVLPRGVIEDADRLARFEREARLLASLNHPNIAAIYRVVHADGVRALILELVEGHTLADRMANAASASRNRVSGAQSAASSASTGLPLDESLRIARQIALALEAAHDRGIVHRDLKPANVRITPAGIVKVLDFGLAKLVDPSRNHAGSLAATLNDRTMPGAILGTAAYMAPEQAKGVDVDRRADLWALGCVLFEMLAGHRPFEADSLPGLLLKVVNDPPDWQALPLTTPAALRTLLRRCLEKDPLQRIDSAAVVRLGLDDLMGAESASRGHTAPSVETRPQPAIEDNDWHASRGRWRLVTLVLLAAVAGAIAIGVWRTGRRQATVPVDVLRLKNPMQVTSSLGVEDYAMWSPDGGRIAYHAGDDVYSSSGFRDTFMAQVGGGDPVNLTNTLANNKNPSWSPDGREIAFLSNRSGAWAVYTIPAIGGNARQSSHYLGSMVSPARRSGRATALNFTCLLWKISRMW